VKPSPACKTVLFCDRVTRDASGKFSLHGLFGAVRPASYPARMGPFFIFLSLEGGVGEYEIAAELRDLADDSPVAAAPPLAVRFRDRLAAMDIPVGPVTVTLPHAGAYDFVVFAAGEEVARRRVVAV
jgi:hypothetical protein